MAILLSDTFAGTGLLDSSHIPEIGVAGASWTADPGNLPPPLSISGGSAYGPTYSRSVYKTPTLTDISAAQQSWSVVLEIVPGDFNASSSTLMQLTVYTGDPDGAGEAGFTIEQAGPSNTPDSFRVLINNATPAIVTLDRFASHTATIAYDGVSGLVSLTVGSASISDDSYGISTTGVKSIDLNMANGTATLGSIVFTGVEIPAVGAADVAAIAPSPTLLANGGGYAAISSPPCIVQSAGTSAILANAALTAPTPILTAHSGAQVPNLTAPSPRLTSHGHDSTGEQAAHLTSPSPVLTITTGANSKPTAPRPTLSTSGTVTALAKATLSAPKPALSAAGTVTELAHANLSAPSPNLVGYSGAVCSVSITGSPTLTATGTTGGVASVAVTCPLFELTSVATAQNHGGANLLAPSPRLGAQAQAWLAPPSARLTAIGSAVVTATYEAYAVNLGHRPRVTDQEQPIDEVTRYTNFPFTHVVRYQNSYYGANSTGLYLLEGTTDAGAAIPWAVKTAMDDFKTPMKKTVAAAYFGGRFGPASTVQLHAGEDAPNTYSFTTPRDALAQNHRQVFGKGVKERYFALGASGTGAVELDTIELETHNMTRRI